MSVVGHFHPADSLPHRLPAGVKLLALIAAAIALFLTASLPVLGAVAAGVSLLYAMARLPIRLVTAQLRPITLLVLMVFGLQWLLIGWHAAAVNCSRLVILIALATLVTLTTRTTEMVATVERAFGPLRRVGVDPGRIGLLMALAIRSVAVLTDIAREVRAAQRARGIEWSLVGFVLPFVIRTLKQTDALGEALTARGLDDD